MYRPCINIKWISKHHFNLLYGGLTSHVFNLLLKQPKQSYKNHTLQQTSLYEFIYKTAFQCTVVQLLWLKFTY